MQNKKFNFGPVIMSATLTTNILNPPTATGGVGAGSSAQYILLSSITISNKTGSAATFSLWKDATGGNTAGKEFIGTAVSIPANSTITYPASGNWRFDAADFLVGGAGTGSALTISGTGEIGVSG